MSKATVLLAMLVGGVVASGCAKASKEDCEKFAEHTIDLSIKEMGGDMPAALAEAAKKEALEGKDEIVGECEGKVAKSDIDCALAASTMDELNKCGSF